MIGALSKGVTNLIEIRYALAAKRYDRRKGWYSIGGEILTTIDAETLQGVDLSNRILDYADLKGVNLSHANLKGISLIGADLQGSNLTGCELENADLTGTNLERAILIGADLHNTVLMWSSLHQADLRETNLAGAEITSSYYDEYTQWPQYFNPTNSGAVLGKREENLERSRAGQPSEI